MCVLYVSITAVDRILVGVILYKLMGIPSARAGLVICMYTSAKVFRTTPCRGSNSVKETQRSRDKLLYDWRGICVI